MKTALFTGTFDPFTIGHHSVVTRALPLFDRIVIGVGVNERKQTRLSAQERREAIERLYADDPRVEVVTYTGLTVVLAHSVGASCILRGVRSVADFEYERQQADLNRRIGHIETLLLYAEPGMDSISSSAVRELEHFGYPTDSFIPHKQ